MQAIFLVRHGETQWNAEGRMQGRIQHISLDGEGRRQSALLSKRLEKERIDIIYSSPLDRALETAEILAGPHSASIITHEGISERLHGSVDGMTKEEFRSKFPETFIAYEKTRELPGIEGAETMGQLSKRAMAAFMEIVSQNPGKNILIVSHGGICKSIISAITGRGTMSFRQHNCCLNIIRYDGKRFIAEKVDDTSHLEMDGG